MKILFFTKYTEKGPSSRYRTFQYLKFFKEYRCVVIPFFDKEYSNKKRSSLFYLFKCYLKRIKSIFSIKKDCLVVIEYELLPYMPFINLFNLNYIVDYDDAIFHYYDQSPNLVVRTFLKSKIKNVIKNADAVITGSSYLTEYALKHNKNVYEIPTSIDIQRYSGIGDNLNFNKNDETFVIGWIGSLSTSINLVSLVPVFQDISFKIPNLEIHLIGFDKKLEFHFDGLNVVFIDWNHNTEIECIRNFSVGIMPLEDTLFNKGKCAFKLIQYMACSLPTISSPFTSNIDVDRNNENLFAKNRNEWKDCFLEVKNNPEKYKEIGNNNFKIIDEFYSIQSNYSKYVNIFKSVNND